MIKEADFGESSCVSSVIGTSFNPEIRSRTSTYIKKIDLARNRLLPSLDLTPLSSWKLLQHSNILTLYDYYIESTYLCLELEAFESENLVNFIWSRETNIPEKEALKIIQQILSAIIYIHSQKYFHGCLHTENILISSSLEIKVSEFGISKLLSKNWSNYSPEVVKNQPYTYASEVWSVGCIFYEILNRIEPFSSVNPFSLTADVLKSPPQEMHGEYSERLKNLVLKMLEKNPKNRITLDEAAKIILKMTGIDVSVSIEVISLQSDFIANSMQQDESFHPHTVQLKRKTYKSPSRKSSVTRSSLPDVEKTGILVEDYLRRYGIRCISFDTGTDFRVDTLLFTNVMKTFLSSYRAIFVVSINSEAFECSPNGVFLLLSPEIKRIGQNCFACMKRVEEIYIFHPVIEVDDNAFFDCKHLRNVALPPSVKTIGSSVFSGCSKMDCFIFPKSVVSIGDRCFQGCSNLVELWVPKSLVKIGNQAFVKCELLFEKEGQIDIQEGCKFKWKEIRAYSF
jgi:serine/threonine protein kinase